MSRAKILFGILWRHAATNAGAFEIEEVADQAAARLGGTTELASHQVRSLLGELDRMPEGKQFFALEGNAVVPLAEYSQARDSGVNPDDAYPYEE